MTGEEAPVSGSFVDVWVNCPDRAVAERIAQACVAERLAACANILPPVSSLYRWKGAVEHAEEVPLLLKTRAGLFEALCAVIKPLHPYETPGIVATAIVDADRTYCDWLDQETRDLAPR